MRFPRCSCLDCRHAEKSPRPGVRRIQLWRLLTDDDTIQPGDHYSSSMCGGLYRCTPDMMGKRIPFMAMPHLRPTGTFEETVTP